MDCHRRHIEHRSILSLNSRGGNLYDSVQRTACIQIYYTVAQRMDLVKERSERLVAALRHTCQLKFQTGGIRWVSYAYLPPFPQNMPEVQRRLAKASEYGLYALLLFQPLTGLAQSLARGRHFMLFAWHLGIEPCGNAGRIHRIAEHRGDVPALAGGFRLTHCKRQRRAHDVELLIHRVVRGDEIAQLSTARRHRAPQR
jgi:hypothetical protein